MSEEASCSGLSCTPPEIRQLAETAKINLLPAKSRAVYEKEYQSFQSWCQGNNIQAVTENIMLAYFKIKSENKKPSTLWASYSMLKLCLNIYKNVDISQYNKLQAYLKSHSKGYVPKKSRILEAENVNRFIVEAEDKQYLAIKVR